MEIKINVTLGLDCETLRFLADLMCDKGQHEKVIAAGNLLQASTEAFRVALEKAKGVS